MTRPPRTKTESVRDRADRLTRRAFVVGAGSAVVAGSTRRAAAASDEYGVGPLTVEATAPYYRAVDGLVGAFEGDAAGYSVDVAPADADPAQRIREGPADVVVSGVPLSSVDGAAPDADAGPDLGGATSILGWATLATRTGDWRESLRGRTLTDRVRGDRPVETWSETDWESVGRLTDETGDAAAAQCSALVSTGAERTSLVRGSRAYQYAHGQGGVGYYEVDAADVGAPSTTRRRGDDVVPLVRLGYVAVDEAAAERSETDAFLRSFRRRSSPASDVRHHADPGPALAAL